MDLAITGLHMYGLGVVHSKWDQQTSDDQECPENDRECVAKLSGTVLTIRRIVRTQDNCKLIQDGWDNID